MSRSTLHFVVCFLLVVVAVSGCTASANDVEAAESEAAADFAVIENALQDFADTNGEFPRSSSRRMSDALSELGLDADVTAPTDDQFSYYFQSYADSGGPPCRYQISLVEPRIDITAVFLTEEHTICDPAAVQQLEDERRARDAAALEELPEIGRALEAYYDQNGAFPVSLDALELEPVHVEAYIVYRDGSGPLSARNGEMVRDFDPDELCRYELWVGNLGLDNRRRAVNNCE